MTYQKKANVFIFDVGYSWKDVIPGHSKSMLEEARQVIRKKLEDKISIGRKTDMTGLIAIGTPETDNSLASQFPGEYKNISTIEEIKQPTVKTVQKLFNIELSESKETTADALDALILAIDMIVCHCRKLKYDKHIYLMTDTRVPISWMENHEIISMLETHSISLTVVCAGSNMPYTNQNMNENEKKWIEIISRLGPPSSFCSFEKEYEFADTINKKIVRASPCFRGNIILGDPANSPDNGLYVSAHMFIRSDLISRKSGTKCYVPSYPVDAEDGKNIHPVKAETNYRTITLEELEKKFNAQNDFDPEEEQQGEDEEGLTSSDSDNQQKDTVNSKDIMKAYILGKTLVPVSKEQQDMFKVVTSPGLYVIKFIDSEKFPETYKLSKVYTVTAGSVDAKEAATVITALAKAMEETKSVAVVRFTNKPESPPKLGVLFPLVEEKVATLYFVEAPFSNDLKPIPEAIEEALKPKDNEESKNASNIAKLEIMEKLVESMSLMEVRKDKDGNPCEHVVPENIFNPNIWRVSETIRRRAIDGKATIPDLHHSIKEQITVLPEFVEKTKELGKQIKEIFNIEKVETPDDTKERHYGALREEKIKTRKEDEDHISPTDTGDIEQNQHITKKMKMDNGSAFDTKNYEVLRKDVKEVSIEDPVDDFKAMVANPDQDLVEEAFKQISDIVIHLVSTSFGDQYYKKVISCLDCMRNVAIQDFEGESFNRCLHKIKSICDLSNPASKRLDFWEILKKTDITPLTKDETGSSNVTEAEAKKFMEEIDTTDMEPNIQTKKSYIATDDLLDLF
ncbi:SPOC like C-terminal domain-containing protein [Phycomyces blakesleeanus]